MKNIAVAILATFFVFPATFCLSQEQSIPNSKITWRGIYGTAEGNEHNSYVLMGQQFMGLPGLGGPTFGKDLEGQISDWIQKHPKAKAVLVFREPFGETNPFLYVWLIDGDENLNLSLVRKGNCPAKNMLVDDNSVVIDRDKYEQFRRSALEAQHAAIKDKLGVWAMSGMEGESRWQNAELFEEQGRLEEAIAEYQAAASADGKVAAAWHRIALLHDKLGRYESALEAFDKSIAAANDELSARFAKMGKAECILKHGGADPTAVVFGDLKEKCSEDLTPCLDAAVTYVPSNRRAAIEILEPAVHSFLSHHQIQFENDKLLYEEKRVKDSDGYWLAINNASRALPTLANYCLEEGQLDKAMKYATQGLTIHQQILQHSRRVGVGHHDEETVEAGDFHARFVRARVFMVRSLFDEAKRELDFAKVIVDVGGVQGRYYQETIDGSYAKLRSQFPNREVTMPPKHVLKHQERSPSTKVPPNVVIK